MERHSLTVSSSRAASGEASAWARSLAARAGLSEERIDRIDLCIVELVSNVVDHGYRGASGEIRVDLDLAGGAAILTVTDAAREFDPLTVAPPAVPALIEDAKIGGYGVHLVRSTAARCKYERRAGRNVFTAWFD
jgi:anti-sigma regulatory factor (Ser/Thr protein kinase)